MGQNRKHAILKIINETFSSGSGGGGDGLKLWGGYKTPALPLTRSAALLILRLGLAASDGTSVRRYSNPYLIVQRRFCSAIDTFGQGFHSFFESNRIMMILKKVKLKKMYMGTKYET